MNTQQLSAAQHINSHSLILACPGAGKTRTLIAKAKTLIEMHGPLAVVLITFTRKAGEQLKEKIERDDIRVGTFHSLAFKLLRQYKYKKYGNVIHILLQEEIDDFFRKNFGHKKKKKLTHIEILKYKEFKNKFNRIDFDDILYDFAEFLDTPESLKERQLIKHLLVDEYQDINEIQEIIINKWINLGAIFTAVGDEGQSIYGFRGSNINFILNFAYPGYKKFILFKNYRNPPSVVRIAKKIIPNKEIEAQKNKGKVFINRFLNSTKEAEYIAKTILKKNKLTAILVRYHRQTPIIEIQLKKYKINYKICKRASIFDSPVLRFFLSICRVYLDKTSIPDWLTIFTYLPTIGNRTANKIINNNFQFKNSKAEDKCKDIYLWIYSLSVENIGLSMQLILEKINIVLNQKILITKSDIIREKLLKDVSKLLLFKQNIAIDTTQELTEFLGYGVINDNNTTTEQEKTAQVEIVSIHQSKGLEWDRVFIPNVSFNYFPEPTRGVNHNSTEEERRLYYVAVTRCINELHLSYIDSPSIFISESLSILKKKLKNTS